MERLEISISEEELKKGIEEDGADGCEDEVQYSIRYRDGRTDRQNYDS